MTIGTATSSLPLGIQLHLTCCLNEKKLHYPDTAHLRNRLQAYQAHDQRKPPNKTPILADIYSEMRPSCPAWEPLPRLYPHFLRIYDRT